MLVFNDPITGVVTLCKATPRVWLTAGKKISVRDAPLGQRRLSFQFVSKLNDPTPTIAVNITITGQENSPSNASMELVLSLRVPDGYLLSGAVMDGQQIPENKIDTRDETVNLSPFNATDAQVIVSYKLSG